MPFGALNLLSPVISFALGTGYARWNDRRRIKYCADGETVIHKRDAMDGLVVSHHGEPVDRITRSFVSIWNAGKGPIKPEDMVADNPLRLTLEDDSRILSVRTVHRDDDVVKVAAVSSDDGSWRIEFAHWERDASVVLEVIHTSPKLVPKLIGTISGFQPVKCLGRVTTGAFLPARRRWLYRLAPALAIPLFAAGVWAVSEMKLMPDPKTILGLLLIAPGEFLLIVYGIEFIVNLRVPRSVRRFSIDSISKQ
ncbi:hypothetical protein [Paraburkholderia caffeinilytica]|uniref:hypothetical protein n=1 Tax=Paraburkholderia caffeinilytica TaxID=1761016 RepID=UPI0038B84448